MVVALLLLVAQRRCAFATEVVVVLYLLWGGGALALVPANISDAAIRRRRRPVAIVEALFAVSNWLVHGLSTWFYVRLWLVERGDFVETRGTSIELRHRFGAPGSAAFCRFTALILLLHVKFAIATVVDCERPRVKLAHIVRLSYEAVSDLSNTHTFNYVGMWAWPAFIGSQVLRSDLLRGVDHDGKSFRGWSKRITGLRMYAPKLGTHV